MSVDELVAAWFLTARQKSAANVPFRVDTRSVMSELLGGRNRRDADGSVIDDLGYRLSLWNGDDSAAVGLSIKCGMSNSTPGLSNAVVINLPPRSQRCGYLYSRAGAAALLEVVVEAWAPDWATVTSNSLREAQGPLVGGRPVLGWMTYFSDRRGDVPELPKPFDVSVVAGSGSIVTTGEEPPGPSVLEDLRLALGSILDPTG